VELQTYIPAYDLCENHPLDALIDRIYGTHGSGLATWLLAAPDISSHGAIDEEQDQRSEEKRGYLKPIPHRVLHRVGIWGMYREKPRDREGYHRKETSGTVGRARDSADDQVDQEEDHKDHNKETCHDLTLCRDTLTIGHCVYYTIRTHFLCGRLWV